MMDEITQAARAHADKEGYKPDTYGHARSAADYEAGYTAGLERAAKECPDCAYRILILLPHPPKEG